MKKVFALTDIMVKGTSAIQVHSTNIYSDKWKEEGIREFKAVSNG